MSTKITITTGETTITIETDEPVSVTEESAPVEKPDEKPEYVLNAYYPNSSFISALYWLPNEDDEKTVEMYTNDGNAYRYNLTREQFDAWGTAESVGHWYHENIAIGR